MSLRVTVDGRDFDLEVEYEPGDPGRTSGPPEDCWPPEPPYIEVKRAWLLLDDTRVDLDALPEDLVRCEYWQRLETAALSKLEGRSA